MKRRRFIVGLVGVAVGGRYAYKAIDTGPIDRSMSASDAKLDGVETEREDTEVTATATVENLGVHVAKITVVFVPSSDAPKKTASVSVTPGKTGSASVTWQTEYEPSIRDADVEAEIKGIESTEDIL